MREPDLNIAVVGSGISGLSAAWLLSQRHRVTLYEAAPRLGGHTNTVMIGQTPVDTGFIVFNTATYHNLTALFTHLGVQSRAAEMSFGVSLDGGRLEYEGTSLRRLFAQPVNLVRPRFLSMLREIMRFYREAPLDAADLPLSVSLGDYLDANRYGAAFQQDHLLPMAAAIWSASAHNLRDYPAAHFIRFCSNHGLLQVTGRPVWRTVVGGSHTYLQRLLPGITEVRTGTAAVGIHRIPGFAEVSDSAGQTCRYDHVVIATHADQALALLNEPTRQESTLLGTFRSTENCAVLHTDPRFMPRRKAVWSSWNYVGRRDHANELHVTYWMNRLQGLPAKPDLFVTLNPGVEPAPGTVLRTETYRHPLFNAEAMRAQASLWSLQGQLRTWFCGAWFGAGFHEDGLQAGLAVAEQLGGVRRPWSLPDESDRIHVTSFQAAA